MHLTSCKAMRRKKTKREEAEKGQKRFYQRETVETETDILLKRGTKRIETVKEDALRNTDRTGFL
ncbi:MAG TPA: hypothetical protein DEP61_06840, partial [Lachnospiraceae bacterium]|nr:hypothetical protein [Lachnospiraceae bacterium]